MDSLEVLVERVTSFFCRVLPASRLTMPATKTAVEAAFKEAEFCHQVSSSSRLPPVYRPVVLELETQWPLCQAPRLLFLSLCDNVRINTALLTWARQTFDQVTSGDQEGVCPPDLESWVCAEQRNLIRDQFVAVSQSVKEESGGGWSELKSYMCWLDLASRGEGRLERELDRLIKGGKVEKVLRGLLIQDPRLIPVQSSVIVLLTQRLTLEQVFPCPASLLASLCMERGEVVDLLVRLVREWVRDRDCAMDAVERVGDMLASLLLTEECKYPHVILERLEEEFRNDSFVKSEIVNYLAVKLRLNKP